MMAPRGRNERLAPGESQPAPVNTKTRPVLTPALLARLGPGDFLGEISLFTGERMFITACVREAAAIYRIGAEAFRQLMAQDAELSDLILTALYRRRGLLKTALAGTRGCRAAEFSSSVDADGLCRTNGTAAQVDRRGDAPRRIVAQKPRTRTG
jgi:CRP-like cAMP-binding protein